MTAGPRPVRAPRGTASSCKGWAQEAALRCLMNNLDLYRSQPRDTKIRLYGREAFEGMRRAGQLASSALDLLAEHV